MRGNSKIYLAHNDACPGCGACESDGSNGVQWDAATDQFFVWAHTSPQLVDDANTSPARLTALYYS